jgi:hypothetical protein
LSKAARHPVAHPIYAPMVETSMTNRYRTSLFSTRS